jgi:hypothetical protein
MCPGGATIVLSTQYAMAVLWLISSFMTATAFGDTCYGKQNPQLRQNINIKSKIDHRFQCTDLGAGNSFCTVRTKRQYRKYLDTLHIGHDQFTASSRDNELPSSNLMAVFKLALEEFNLLSGVRIYWEYTERNIRQLAVKLKLKGEIAITDPHDRTNRPSLQNTKRQKSLGRRKSTDPGGISAVLMPQTIRWNIGLNPEDFTVIADLHINPHICLNGRIGDEDQIGIYFRYAF